MRIHRHMQRKLKTPRPRRSRGLFSGRPRLLLHLTLLGLALNPVRSRAETAYVVERERGSLAVLENEKWQGEIHELGDTSHTTVKLKDGFAYAISRDGFVSKIDPATNKVLKKVKVGNSGIGMNFVRDYVAVANYDPGNVVILDHDLNIIKTIETGSRNVGIKALENKLIFALMDKNEIRVLDADNDFALLKKFTDVGKLPFDALLAGRRYVVGFFNESRLGIVDLDKLEYQPMALKQDNKEMVLKIPHFGLWGIAGDTVFIPANKDKKLHVVSLPDFKYQGTIDLIGTPVFVAASPDGKTLAVNYSGEKENFITIVNPVERKVERNIEAGKRIMHFRFSANGKRLYASSYFENLVRIFEVGSWQIKGEIAVPTPSGIFLVK